jgi:hypothetical protein
MGMSRSVPSLELVHQAIAAGIFGHIQWEDRADKRARSNPALQGLTPEGIRRLLHEFVAGGGRVEERPEVRADWLEANADRPAYYRDFWYPGRAAHSGPLSQGLVRRDSAF